MKKFFAALMAVVACFSLVACGGKKDQDEPAPAARTYKADGKYTAFAWQDNDGAPQVTWVTVEIENDEIVDIDIDCLQGKCSNTGTEESPVYACTWNEKTKKELGWAYHMFYYTTGETGFNAYASGTPKTDAEYQTWCEENGHKEWFQQAELVEQYMLANGADAVQLGEKESGEGENLYFQNITGVSIADNDYVALTKEAIQNAIDGKVIKLVTSIDYTSQSAQINWVEATIDADKKIQSVELDAIQSTCTTGSCVWKEQTKQQLGWAYHMFYYTTGEEGFNAYASGTPKTDAEYQTWCEETGHKEWFQQAALICAQWMAKGDMSVEGGYFTAITGVSIANNDYVAVLDALESEFGCSR